ncbi:MAG: ABC transporter substrate-binding protein [Chloroflexaceae bacterium]|nr:ABC transporter substrate-binding protein [Chloroflexaceae bacterium]NJO06792.1 ABC transporter substrate-binding protein [Chloroflexaceae bacterium]
MMQMRLVRWLLVLVVPALMVAACGGTAPNTSTEPAATTNVTMLFGFIPNVQFAPFYVADSKGYYEEAGLSVTFEYNMETDVLQRVATAGTDAPTFAHGSGLSVMLARQQGLPVQMVFQHYQQFPVVFFAKPDVPLESPQDLLNQSIGIPGRFGASYYALQALLYASGIPESELNVQEVGFNQFQLILEDNIAVASGYAMNEPVRLREQLGGASVLRVADYFPLASDGIITSEELTSERSDLVRAFVQATLRGLQDTFANSDEAFEISLDYIPEANLGTPEFERTVLQESLPYWEAENLGTIDPEVWQQSHQFLLDLNLLQAPVDVEASYTNQFVQ